jgi:outer membrane autotransporter protein
MDEERKIGRGIFMTLSGGWSRYNTGGHVDIASQSLLTGLSFGSELTPGYLTTGAFIEFARGTYDTYNSFPGFAAVHGDGDLRYFGGGVLGRLDFNDSGPGHAYTEASLRLGTLNNEYLSQDLRGLDGRKAEYESDSAYYGFHLGAGYIWEFVEKTSLDIYGKYFWTKLKGDSLTLSTGDPIQFQDVDSHRLRLGTRLDNKINEYASPYAGLAYEYEFDGRARATTHGYVIDAPELSGGTTIGTIGLNLKPSPGLPVTLDFTVEGFAGKRDGVSGSVQIRYEF